MSASIRCRGCGQHHSTPRVIQALPRPSVEEQRLPRWWGTAVVGALFLLIAALGGFLPGAMR